MTTPDADGFAPERWTYGGTRPGAKRAQVAIWYDASRRRLTYAPLKGTSPVVGGVYQVSVRRDGDRVTRSGEMTYAGRSDDAAWVAQLEAAAYDGQRMIAAEQLERREARDGGELAKLIAPLEAAAANMTHAQRDALAAMVTRRIYTARPERRPR